jgi:hypothetical protein
MKQMKNTQFIGLAAALLLFVASCENNNGLDNHELSGKDVPVRIRSLGVAEAGSETLMRSSLQGKPEMISKPIGNGMLLEMSVERDESSLRGLVNLAPGTHFRVIAVNQGTSKYYSHGDFVQGTGISPLTDFHVHVGTAYDYICISYNNATLPDASAYAVGSNLSTSFSVNNTQDLLWCRIAGSTVTSAGVELDIALYQKLAKVKMTVDCEYNKWKITSIATNTVSIKAVPLNCTINWVTGALTGTANDQAFVFPSPSSPYSTTHTSNELRIIPTTSNAAIQFAADAISRENIAATVPTGTTTLTFTTPLSAGVNYTLHIKVRTPIWARSNIYWDNGAQKLTFVPAGSSTTEEGWQGVFFKFGSLVAFPPTGAFSSSLTLYKPSGTTTYPTWGEIPYWGDANTSTYGNVLDNSHTDQLVGDICLYLNSAYRLPVVGEFGSTNNNYWTAEGWEKGGGSIMGTNGNAYGTTDIIGGGYAYAMNTSMDNIRFPASGQRTSDHSGAVAMNEGVYRTASASSSTNCTIAAFGVYYISTRVTFDARNEVYSVRCVKK